MFSLESNYFIKENYISLKKIERLNIQYWEENYRHTNKSYYLQYYVYKFCKKLIKKKRIKSILDIGCRSGIKLKRLLYHKCLEIYGIDLEEYFIDICKRKCKSNNFFVDNIENSNLNLNRKFDLIICSDVIEHLLNPNNLIFYIKKYCTNNTYIIISTPERDLIRGINCSTPPSKRHIREWNSIELRKYLKYNNFKIIFYKNVFHAKKSFIIKNLFLKRKKSFKTYLYNFKLLFKILFIKKSIELKKLKSTQLILCKLES